MFKSAWWLSHPLNNMLLIGNHHPQCGWNMLKLNIFDTFWNQPTNSFGELRTATSSHDSPNDVWTMWNNTAEVSIFRNPHDWLVVDLATIGW